ncbi:MAG TPA: hypothetical protein VEU29_04330 [Actinomycetota bacterium]|nr:hypothetical protein [Actinomycetota bacterium]
MAQSEPLPARRRAPSIDEILSTLVASGVLETLDITNDDLARARTDSDLLETLTITFQLLETFDAAGVLDTFNCLPRGDQAKFLRWIGSTDDPATRTGRTDTFVSALHAAPLAPRPSRREARDHPG